MKKIFITRVLFALMLLLTAFARGQTPTISNVVISTPAAAPYCSGASIRVSFKIASFPTGDKKFNISLVGSGASIGGAGTVYLATTTTGTTVAGSTVTTASGGITLTVTEPGPYKIRVEYDANTTIFAVSADYNMGIKPVGTASTSNNICSGSPFNHTLMADLPGTTFSWSSITATGFSESPIPAASGVSSISQVLTASAGANATAPSVTYSVTPNGSYGCNGSPFSVKVTVFKIINPGAFSPASKTICSGTTLQTITTTGTALLGSTTPILATYKWYRDNVLVPGQTAAAFTENEDAVLTNTSGVAIDHVYKREVILGGGACTGETNTYTLTVMPKVEPGSITAPAVTTFCASGSAGSISTNQIISAGTPASGDATFTYTWEYKTTGSFSPTSPAATTDNYTLPLLNADRTYQRGARTILNGTTCTVYTNPVTITINNVGAGTLKAFLKECKIKDGPDPTFVELFPFG